MFRRVLPLILLVVAVLADTALIPVLSVSPLMPLTSLVSVIVMGLLLGRTRGSLYGMIGGLLVDISVGTPLGLRTVLYLGCGYASGVAGRKFQRYAITPVITPLVLLSVCEAVLMLYLYMAGQTASAEMLRDALLRVGIETVLAQFMYLLYDRILKPSWSRYAAR